MNVVWNKRLAWVISLLMVMTACEQYTDPTPVQRETVTFDGRLEPTASFVGSFPVKSPGIVTVVVNTLVGVDTSITAVGGVAVGTWDGTTCALLVKNENASFSTVISGTAMVGDYCVQVYDVGKFTEAVNYSVEVQHP